MQLAKRNEFRFFGKITLENNIIKR